MERLLDPQMVEKIEMVLQGPNLVSMEFNPSNSNIIHAVTTGTSKYYRSEDNGQTWQNMTNNVGLPNSGNSRAQLAVTADNANVIYILLALAMAVLAAYINLQMEAITSIFNLIVQILSWESDGNEREVKATMI